jgi:hypothetical protein
MVMAERIWGFPIVTTLRERIRARTPGVLPEMREEHPVVGLFHDIQRLVRRRAFGGR